jgi:hypothetical protein
MSPNLDLKQEIGSKAGNSYLERERVRRERERESEIETLR